MKLKKMHRPPRRSTGSLGEQIPFSGAPREGSWISFPEGQIDPARRPSLPVRPPISQSIWFLGRALGELEADSKFFRKTNTVNDLIFLLALRFFIPEKA
jgi:hypothetical protein